MSIKAKPEIKSPALSKTTTKTKTAVASKTVAKPEKAVTSTASTAPTANKPVAAGNLSATVVEAPQPVILGPVMRKKELIELVVTRSGMKKKDAKPVIEAMLSTLGEALADGRELILPPMGRLMVRKERLVANARIMTVKVRQSTGSPDKGPAEQADAKPSAVETPS